MKKISSLFFLLLSPLYLIAGDQVPVLDVGNTSFILIATALVMSMTPIGLAFFYGGMTQSKNILNTIGMSVSAYVITSLIWIFIGYTLAFGTDINGIIGFDDLLLLNINIKDIWTTGNIPTLLFVAFQMTFACITVALISGSVIDRLKFSSWMLFVPLWIIFVYTPIAHWVWGGGFLSKEGVLDFAGGTVVHINAGVAGLILAILLGKRKDFNKQNTNPSSIVLTMLGTGMLWFGWFGFNAGSQLGADGIAANAFLVTNTAAAAGSIGWIFVEYSLFKKFTLLGFASGIVAGLVAITPAAGFVSNSSALIIGFIAGVISFYGATYLKKLLKYDDSLDVFGIHGISGIFGAIATGIFADPTINELGKGLLFGNYEQVLIQIKSVCVTILYTAIMTFIIFKIVSFITNGARIDKEIETIGLDEVVHSEKGFNF